MNKVKKRLVLQWIAASACAVALPVRANAFDDWFAAITRNDVGALRGLLRRGFDVNTLDPDGQHGLFLALRAGADQAAGVLLDQPQIQVEHRNAQGESPLMMAALKGKVALAERLIGLRAEVNKPGWAPLHYAATHSGPTALPLVRLLEHHAYIDASSPNGSTPLMMAARYGEISVVQLLLEEGADPLIRNEQGLTAIEFARRAERPDVAESIAAAVRRRQPAGRW